jgi:hypothetical protein
VAHDGDDVLIVRGEKLRGGPSESGRGPSNEDRFAGRFAERFHALTIRIDNRSSTQEQLYHGLHSATVAWFTATPHRTAELWIGGSELLNRVIDSSGIRKAVGPPQAGPTV